MEVENLGTEENPLYSCTKCFNDLYYSLDSKLKITEEYSKLSYCLDYKESLGSCIEASYKIKDGKEIYNCTTCDKYNRLVYNRSSHTYYCEYTSTKCSVLYCQKCNPI